MGLFALGSCRAPPDNPKITVSIIGPGYGAADPNHGQLTASAREYFRETAVGLVTLDAGGQVRPGLAESWIVTEDGLSLIFRLQPLHWPDGSELTGAQVADALNRARQGASRNSLKLLLSAVDTVTGMTGRVVEIRLKTARPNFLQLLAQPELTVRLKGQGIGPWQARPQTDGSVHLFPRPDDESADPDALPVAGITQITVWPERSARAVIRFQAGGAVLVSGGTLADWPLVQAANLTQAARLDPADGLFGLAIRPTQPLLRAPQIREALAMTIDRDALATLLPRWRPTLSLLPGQLDSASFPALPAWQALDLPQRRLEAAKLLSAWQDANGPIAPLRIALPTGPGMTVVFARLVVDFRAIGLTLVRVGARDPADIVLIDEVAPNSSANWYLSRISCDAGFACSPETERALQASRSAPTLRGRAAALRLADLAEAAGPSFIPLGLPLRWSLVAPSLTGWHENSSAVHPLSELRSS